MGGRVYDPDVQQFLSPDPYVQMPDNTQNLNRYAYCLYSPTMYVDPSGEVAWFVPVIIGAVMGTYAGGTIANQGEANPIKWNYSSGKTWGYMLGGAVIGAASGFAGYAAGAAASASALAGGGSNLFSAFAEGLVSGAITNGLNSAGMTALAGGNIGDVFGALIQGAAVGGLSGAAGAVAFQGMNKLLNMDIPLANGRITLEKPFSILPTNTISYMAGSTASQVAANIVNGKKPFQNVDYGVNLGMLLPLTIDGLKYSRKFAMYMARNQYPNEEIVEVSARATTLMPNGNLHYEQTIGIQEYYPIDFKFEHSKYEYSKVDISFLAGQPFLFPTHIDFNSMLISNYRSLILLMSNF
jgi:hypothetical protein